jgi:hypothetical protein
MSADGVPTRVRPTIAGSRTMLTVFLSGRGAIDIKWLFAGASSTPLTSANIYLGRLLRFCTAGETHMLQDRQSILTMPYPMDQRRLEVFSKTADSVMPLNFPTAMLSVHATSFYSLISKRNSEAKDSRRWSSCKRRPTRYLVRSLRS